MTTVYKQTRLTAQAHIALDAFAIAAGHRAIRRGWPVRFTRSDLVILACRLARERLAEDQAEEAEAEDLEPVKWQTPITVSREDLRLPADDDLDDDDVSWLEEDK